MKAKTEVDTGICGFRATIYATTEDGQFVTFKIDTDCDKSARLADDILALGPIDAFAEIDPNTDSVIMQAARRNLRGCCSGCVVPVGIFKTMQVAANLALPKEISIKIEKE